jgi:hypothetical protein
MEINSNSVASLKSFFYLMGCRNLADELEAAWEEYTKSTRHLLQTDFYGHQDVREMDVDIAVRYEQYQSSLSQLKDVFARCAGKTAVMTDNQKWRRCGL